MAFGATNIIPLIDQINTDKVLVQSAVFGLVSSPLKDEDIVASIPIVYVYAPGSDAADVDEGTNACSQSMHDQITVEYICKIEDLEAVTKEVRDIVVKFSFSPYHSTTVFAFAPRVGGSSCELVDVSGGMIWWRDKFETRLVHRVGLNA